MDYGPGVMVFLPWAATSIWLFRRTRRISPLIVAHMVDDSVGVIFHDIPKPPLAFTGLLGWTILGLLITIVVRATQIAVRGRRPAGAISR